MTTTPGPPKTPIATGKTKPTAGHRQPPQPPEPHPQQPPTEDTRTAPTTPGTSHTKRTPVKLPSIIASKSAYLQHIRRRGRRDIRQTSPPKATPCRMSLNPCKAAGLARCGKRHTARFWAHTATHLASLETPIHHPTTVLSGACDPGSRSTGVPVAQPAERQHAVALARHSAQHRGPRSAPRSAPAPTRVVALCSAWPSRRLVSEKYPATVEGGRPGLHSVPARCRPGP
jgi:hypothetical protein